MTLAIDSVTPAMGSASGGELVRVVARAVTPPIQIRFGDTVAEVVSLRPEGTAFVIEVRTPQGLPGPTTLALTSLQPDGSPGESVSAPFRFLRAPIGRESDLTRVVRALLRLLKDQILANTSTPVSLDYRETTSTTIPVAKVPSLTVLGPDVRENRLYTSSELVERAVTTAQGIEIETLRPPTAVDLRFALEAVTNSTAEHLELFTALVSFFHRNPYLAVPRDAAAPEGDTVRFVLAADGEARAAVVHGEDGRGGRTDDRHALEWGLVIRGFPVDEFIAIDRARPMQSGVQVRLNRAARAS
ncbi:MAG: hypothetical protein ACLQBL_33045 [Polyangiaceae bacterium]